MTRRRPRVSWRLRAEGREAHGARGRARREARQHSGRAAARRRRLGARRREAARTFPSTSTNSSTTWPAPSRPSRPSKTSPASSPTPSTTTSSATTTPQKDGGAQHGKDGGASASPQGAPPPARGRRPQSLVVLCTVDEIEMEQDRFWSCCCSRPIPLRRRSGEAAGRHGPAALAGERRRLRQEEQQGRHGLDADAGERRSRLEVENREEEVNQKTPSIKGAEEQQHTTDIAIFPDKLDLPLSLYTCGFMEPVQISPHVVLEAILRKVLALPSKSPFCNDSLAVCCSAKYSPHFGLRGAPLCLVRGSEKGSVSKFPKVTYGRFIVGSIGW